MIPKKIHYCWFGRGKKSAKFQMCLDSWSKVLPEYELKEWNEDNFDVNMIPYTKEAYHARKWAHVTDYVRLYALYNEGGVYMDSDVEVLKPLDRFLEDVAFTGYEAVGHPLTGIMASEKGGKWVEDLMRDYDGRHFIDADGNPDLTQNTTYAHNVMKRAGMRLDQTEENVPGYVHVYPADFFCPKVWGSGDKVKVTPNTHTIHHYVSSWLPWQGKIARWFGEHRLPLVGYFAAYFLRRPDIVFLDLLDFLISKVFKFRKGVLCKTPSKVIKKVVYVIDRMPTGHSPNANVWQKLQMFGSDDDACVVDLEKGERIPKDCTLLCYDVMGTKKLARACFRRIFSFRKYALLLWDPPGITRQDGRTVLDRLLRWSNNHLLEFAGCGAEKIVWNLHPGFCKTYFSEKLQRRSAFFPNGTFVDSNLSVSNSVDRVRGRIAVNSAFTIDKGCLEVAEIIKGVWQQNPDLSVVWLGEGQLKCKVISNLLNAGISPKQIIAPGIVPYDQALHLLGTAEVALNFYHDIPSLRWNYILKAPEFMSLGVPIVTVESPGVCEYVKNGETGVVISDCDIPNFVTSICDLLANDDKRSSMRAQCLKRVQDYDWRIINARIMAYLKDFNVKKVLQENENS